MNDLTPEERSDLIQQYRRMALLAARPFRHPSIDRADIRQIAMLAMIRAIDSYDPKLGALSNHIWVRVVYALNDEMKRIKRHMRSAAPLHGRDVPAPREDDDARDIHQELWAAIYQLPHRDQRLLIHFFGLSGPAIPRKDLVHKYGLSRCTITKSTKQSVRVLREALSA